MTGPGELYDTISGQFSPPMAPKAAEGEGGGGGGAGGAAPAVPRTSSLDLASFVVVHVADAYDAAITDMLANVAKINQSLEWVKASKGTCARVWHVCVFVLSGEALYQGWFSAPALRPVVTVDQMSSPCSTPTPCRHFFSFLLLPSDAPAGTASSASAAVTDSDKIHVQLLLDVGSFVALACEVVGAPSAGDSTGLPTLDALRARFSFAAKFLEGSS